MTDLKAFDITLSGVRQIIKDFRLEMERGLAGKSSSLKMIPTYVTRPTGREKGKFIALDLGGTNFRILELTLKGGGKIGTSSVMKFVLDKKHISGSAEFFFDFIADSVKTFLKKYKLGSEEEFDLGFTFSFPVKQTGIASGRLVCWTKGFDVRGVVGSDVVELLNEALARKKVRNVKISALVNDTVGTLSAKSYEDPECDVGVILGTGTNACYPEAGLDGMIINIEWGNFDKVNMTAFDRRVDQESTNRGEQIMEKMVSGLYLGGLVSLIAGRDLGIKIELKTEDMSGIEADRTASLAKTASVLKNAGMAGSPLVVRQRIKKICEAVSKRAARLSAACIAAILEEMDPPLSAKHTVAIDGSVYEKHPTFSKNMRACLNEILGPGSARIAISLAKDGSGKGAAIAAAVAASR